MSDIVFDGLIFDRLRQIGDQSNRIAALESEVASLRLTDAEREALLTVRDIYAASGDDSCVRIADAIDGLLERMGGGR